MCLSFLPTTAMATEEPTETFTYTFGTISPVSDDDFFIVIYDPNGEHMGNAYPDSEGVRKAENLDVSKTYTYTVYAGGYEPYSGTITAAQPQGEDIVLAKIESNVTYTIADDTLTISGSGPILDYATWSHTPWSGDLGITHVVIESGITRIGARALVLYLHESDLCSVSIPDTVTSIGEVALGFNPCLKELNIPASVTSIGGWAFDCCKDLTLTFLGSAPSFGEDIFYRTTGVTVCYPAADTSWNGVIGQDYGSDETVIWQPYGPAAGLAVTTAALSTPTDGKVSVEISEADDQDIFYAYDVLYRVVSQKPSAIEVGTYVGDDDTWEMYLEFASPALPEPKTVDAQDGSYIEAVAVDSDYTVMHWGVSTATNDGYSTGGGSGSGSSGGNTTVTPKPEQPKDEEKPAPPISFTDIPSGAYYADAVSWAVEKGITEGVGGGSFAPEASCTRGQMMTFLWRMAGCPTVNSGASFSDVTTDSYYADAVAWAVEKGITNGMGDGLFAPDAECSRAQMATFLVRMVGASAEGSGGFGDVDASAWYAQAVAWAAANGITTGTGDGLFSPNANCTRGQMVTFLFRCFAE